MYFGTKNYLKSNRDHTAKQTMHQKQTSMLSCKVWWRRSPLHGKKRSFFFCFLL
jgi:hypothetical protein